MPSSQLFEFLRYLSVPKICEIFVFRFFTVRAYLKTYFYENYSVYSTVLFEFFMLNSDPFFTSFSDRLEDI